MSIVVYAIGLTVCIIVYTADVFFIEIFMLHIDTRIHESDTNTFSCQPMPVAAEAINCLQCCLILCIILIIWLPVFRNIIKKFQIIVGFNVFYIFRRNLFCFIQRLYHQQAVRGFTREQHWYIFTQFHQITVKFGIFCLYRKCHPQACQQNSYYCNHSLHNDPSSVSIKYNIKPRERSIFLLPGPIAAIKLFHFNTI